jgi:hypothetical protein
MLLNLLKVHLPRTKLLESRERNLLMGRYLTLLKEKYQIWIGTSNRRLRPPRLNNILGNSWRG